MKKLAEEMQSLVVDTDEIVKDSNGLVTEFRLSDWDWDKQRGWVPKPFKDGNHTKRKYEHLPSSPELERGFYYRKETQRKNIPRDNSTRPELCDLLSNASSARVYGSVSSVPIRSLDKTREPKLTDSKLHKYMGTTKRATPDAYETIPDLSVYLPGPTLSTRLSEQANKLWKYSSKKRKWDLLSL